MAADLTPVFLAHPSGAAAAAAGWAPGSLESTLQACLARARAAWPRIALDDAAFVSHLALHSAPAGTPDEAVPAAHVEDLFLACACAAGEPRALSAFEERYVARVPTYVGKLQLAATVIEETRQALRDKLLVAGDGGPKIAQYAGSGTLESWVCIAALRTALSLLRRARPEPARRVADEALPAGDLELEILKARYGPEFAAAFRDAVALLPARDRNLLRLHYVEGVAMVQIAKAQGTHRTTIARWLEEAHAALLAETRRLLRERLGLSAPECDSVIRLVRSRIEVSLSGLLAAAEP